MVHVGLACTNAQCPMPRASCGGLRQAGAVRNLSIFRPPAVSFYCGRFGSKDHTNRPTLSLLIALSSRVHDRGVAHISSSKMRSLFAVLLSLLLLSATTTVAAELRGEIVSCSG